MKERVVFLAMVAGAMLIAGVPLVYRPFSWLETLFHELGHGLAALLTGGTVEYIELHWYGGGACHTIGGQVMWVLWAGYAGSALWGGLIYMSAAGAHGGRVAPWMTFLLLLTLGAMLGLWVRDAETWVILWVLVGFLGLTWLLRDVGLMVPLLRFTGLSVVMDAVRAPLNLLGGSPIPGDSALLAARSGVPELVWFLGWQGLALLVLWGLWRLTLYQARKSC
jgi:hypothetical protein